MRQRRRAPGKETTLGQLRALLDRLTLALPLMGVAVGIVTMAASITLGVIGSGSSATAVIAPNLRVAPTTQTVAPDSDFTITLQQTSDVPTSGVQATVHFDPTQLQIVTIQRGTAYTGSTILVGVAPNTGAAAITEANTTGALKNFGVFFNPGTGPAPAGDQPAMVLKMHSLPTASGSTDITLTNLEMGDETGISLVGVGGTPGSVNVDNPDVPTITPVPPTDTSTATPTDTPTLTPDTPTPTPTATSTSSVPTDTPTPLPYTWTATTTGTATHTPTVTPTSCPGTCPTITNTPSMTPTSTATWTPTKTPTITPTPSPIPTATDTPTATFTATSTLTASATATATSVPTSTPTASAETASLVVVAPTEPVPANTQFTVLINQITNFSASAAQTDLVFDPLLVQVVSVDKGTAYDGAGLFAGVADPDTGHAQTVGQAIAEANTTGTLRNVAVNFPPGAGEAPAGNSTFLSVTMRALGSGGSSMLHLQAAELLDVTDFASVIPQTEDSNVAVEGPTATPTETPTATDTPTATSTSSPTPTSTNTPIATNTSSPTATKTNTSTATATNTSSPSPTTTPCSGTCTPTATATSTSTPAGSPTSTSTAVLTATNTVTARAGTATRVSSVLGTTANSPASGVRSLPNTGEGGDSHMRAAFVATLAGLAWLGMVSAAMLARRRRGLL